MSTPRSNAVVFDTTGDKDELPHLTLYDILPVEDTQSSGTSSDPLLQSSQLHDSPHPTQPSPQLCQTQSDVITAADIVRHIAMPTIERPPKMVLFLAMFWFVASIVLAWMGLWVWCDILYVVPKKYDNIETAEIEYLKFFLSFVLGVDFIAYFSSIVVIVIYFNDGGQGLLDFRRV